MAKAARERTHFVCQECGSAFSKWQGRCSECGAWNSLVEERVTATASRNAMMTPSKTGVPLPLHEVDAAALPRMMMHSSELNRVLGGGLVRGSVVLIGGDPGIGKSTLLLQEAARIGAGDLKALYVSGEESVEQIKMRADRLGVSAKQLYLMAETEIETVLDAAAKLKPALLVIDSIQTMYTTLLESAPGSIGQVRECAFKLIKLAKEQTLPVFMVGHVTKEGFLAGPKTLEHMVDTLVLFEGDRDQLFRILRAAKNRFGSTREIGVFEMKESGLEDVPNPSALFLSERQPSGSGAAVACCMEGTRPILVEVQALAAQTKYGYPQRITNGTDAKRLIMLLAVLERRLGYQVSNMDVFLNVVGGLRIDEPAADLAIIISIASSVRNREIDSAALFVGEVGLGGELRAVTHIEARISEAEKMGFQRIIIPKGNARGLRSFEKITIVPAATAYEAFRGAVQ